MKQTPPRKPMQIVKENDLLWLHIRQLETLVSDLRHRLADLEATVAAEATLFKLRSRRSM